MNVDEAVEALQQGECDLLLAFDNEHLKQTPFEHLLVGHADLLPVSGVDEQGEPRFVPSDDTPLPWLAYSPSSYMGRQTASLNQAVNLTPVFFSSMVEMLKQQTLQGQGIAWLPDFSVRRELAQGSLRVVGEHGLIRQVSFYAYRYQSRLHPAGEKVWRALKKIAQDNAFK